MHKNKSKQGAQHRSVPPAPVPGSPSLSPFGFPCCMQGCSECCVRARVLVSCSLLYLRAGAQSWLKSDLTATDSRMTWAPFLWPISPAECFQCAFRAAGHVCPHTVCGPGGAAGRAVPGIVGRGGTSLGLQWQAGVRDKRLGGLRLSGRSGQQCECPGGQIV